MNLITPYSDDKMQYDIEDHQYYLTLEYVKDELGIDLVSRVNTSASDNPTAAAQYVLKQISNEIYSYIYAHNTNNMVQEFFACKLQSTRNIIRKAMLEQLSYECISGALANFSGVNVKTGLIMDRKGIENAVVGFNAKKVLDTIVPEIGVALTYQGQIFMPIGVNIREGY